MSINIRQWLMIRAQLDARHNTFFYECLTAFQECQSLGLHKQRLLLWNVRARGYLTSSHIFFHTRYWTGLRNGAQTEALRNVMQHRMRTTLHICGSVAASYHRLLEFRTRQLNMSYHHQRRLHMLPKCQDVDWEWTVEMKLG